MRRHSHSCHVSVMTTCNSAAAHEQRFILGKAAIMYSEEDYSQTEQVALIYNMSKGTYHHSSFHRLVIDY